jgi:hypothetical protein
VRYLRCVQLQKHIVAFDLPEHRFTDQDAAVYAYPNGEMDFAGNIAALTVNPELRQRMGHRAREGLETGLAWPYQEKHLLHEC